ncbi:16S rRNA (guanine(527)-N(7))-methyltransferase RsmG [Rubrivirga sp. IMCC43871]|uniref:16S rRNA (guanine(527)-N(7))-methyltransferase RsmG n=1 Tax=Rubrivirga sp. IMCC43871 TaxID=3391575 RepID=UPI00398FCACB
MISSLPVPLSGAQRATLDAYVGQMERLNRRVNLVARPADRTDLERHVRHCLALATRPFEAGAVVVDWGSGGGLPAVPLAVAFPEASFIAVDTVGKKTEAVKLFARRLGLDNLTAWNGRAEVYDGPAPTRSVSRATAPLATLWAWHERVATPGADLLCLKGGDLRDERAALDEEWPGLAVETEGLADMLGAEWADKALIAVTG